jgi:Xaa-Pro aminopeptidase
VNSEINDLWQDLEPITDAEYDARLQAVRAAAEAEGLDAVIAYSNSKVVANVRYLSTYYTRFAGHQFTEDGYYMFGSTVCLIPVDGEPLLRTDALWDVVRAMEMSRFADSGASTRLGHTLGEEIAKRGLKRVGVDNWYLFPARDYLELKAAAGDDVEIRPTNLISEVRRVKSPAELERLRRAEKVADIAATRALDAVKEGASEYEIGLIADETLRRLGDYEYAGGAIIGAGANSASGSSLPTRDKIIQRGEWVLLDVLPKFDGYSGDIARMRLAGDYDDLDPELLNLYEATLAMNRAAVGMAKAGVTPKQLNERALEVAREFGVADLKIELLGHATGLDIHDIPDYYYDDTPLKAGEVLTIEPCLLLEGKGGTRIEDVIAITEDGCEVLTNAPRGLLGEDRG